MTASSRDLPTGPEAIARGEAGVAAWEDVVRLQRWAVADHADFYALAGLMVGTLYAFEDLTGVLERQVAGYDQAQQAQGFELYDDTRQVDPAERLQVAVTALQQMHRCVEAAADWANRFWTAIGHIGTDDTSSPSRGDHRDDSVAAAGPVTGPSAALERSADSAGITGVGGAR
ncbi:hypothetical protein [Pseudonocardia charpentierae]|uniref:Uncharacterized protein n=1 Tax=Pseudonocardia charpentierae TaxID=3075545 RepID=A0ABU2NG25_9PSEU|nr:hypothetical protein [Pseudonocardia sp. DSM 45834]MDT0352910.1 hypothetical protein [Pseudonocardia sp. DSM 45834]